MVIAAVLILTVLAFLAIAAPFFARRQPDYWAVIGGSPDPLLPRGSSNAMLKQLEYDHKSGILSEEDYNTQQNILLHGSKIETAGVKAGGVDDIGGEIEMKIAQLRGVQKADVDEIEGRIHHLRRSQPPRGRTAASKPTRENTSQFCSQCGARHQPGDRFCTQCGADLGG